MWGAGGSGCGGGDPVTVSEPEPSQNPSEGGFVGPALKGSLLSRVGAALLVVFLAPVLAPPWWLRDVWGPFWQARLILAAVIGPRRCACALS